MKGGERVENTEIKQLLADQLRLMAERSSECKEPKELAQLSEVMACVAALLMTPR